MVISIIIMPIETSDGKGVRRLELPGAFSFSERNVHMDRISEHPVLGDMTKEREVIFTFDGKAVTGFEGEPIAAALKVHGLMVHRYTAKLHEPRGIFCAIGRCTDCVMIVDGKPNIRTCITPLKEGMIVQTQFGVTPEPFEEVGA